MGEEADDFVFILDGSVFFSVHGGKQGEIGGFHALSDKGFDILRFVSVFKIDGLELKSFLFVDGKIESDFKWFLLFLACLLLSKRCRKSRKKVFVEDILDIREIILLFPKEIEIAFPHPVIAEGIGEDFVLLEIERIDTFFSYQGDKFTGYVLIGRLEKRKAILVQGEGNSVLLLYLRLDVIEIERFIIHDI